MVWQPMPASAKLPSGSCVEVLCGQPAQKVGARASSPAGRAVRGGTGASATSMPSRAQHAHQGGRDDLRRQFVGRREQGGAGGVLLAEHRRPGVGGEVVERVAKLASRRSCASPRRPAAPACRGRSGAAPRSRAARRGPPSGSPATGRRAGQAGAARASRRDAPCRRRRCRCGASRSPAMSRSSRLAARPGADGGQPLLDHAPLQLARSAGQAQIRVEVQAMRRQCQVGEGEAEMLGDDAGYAPVLRSRRSSSSRPTARRSATARSRRGRT